jgi:CelD/BcsL family acetyltransferase involved in cellulose biosynthesis
VVIRIIGGHELDAELVQRWSEIQDSSVEFASPFMSPEFTQAVASCRSDVRVAVIEDAGRITGFFPFHRERFGVGRPVGEMLSDTHGVLLTPGLALNMRSLFRACGLTSWDYHHMIASQAEALSNTKPEIRDSYSVDLSAGIEQYLEDLRHSGSSLAADCRMKKRRLQRDRGTIDFIASSPNREWFETLVRWKSAQYRMTNVDDVLGIRWVRDLLERLLFVNTARLAGMLSAITADGQPVALHFGMRSSSTWNYWFPRYDEDAGRYSPGLLLLMEMMEAAPKTGITQVDLGYGTSTSYKARFQNKAIPLAAGLAEFPSATTALKQLKRRYVDPVRSFVGRIKGAGSPTPAAETSSAKSST